LKKKPEKISPMLLNGSKVSVKINSLLKYLVKLDYVLKNYQYHINTMKRKKNQRKRKKQRKKKNQRKKKRNQLKMMMKMMNQKKRKKKTH